MSITILRGDTLSLAITGLGNISSRAKLWFTVKVSKTDADADSGWFCRDIGNGHGDSNAGCHESD